jgi:lipopolysaccharide biosynthesis glycosyltransferase
MNTVPVVYASDNNYVLPTIVSITSMLKNKNPDTFYHIFILTTELDFKNKNVFFWSDYKNTYRIDFITVNLQEFEESKLYGSWTPVIYAKYFISDLLEDYDKCLWIDGDTIINYDLTELYKTDLKDNYIAAVNSPGTNYNIAAGKQLWLGMERDRYLLKCINVGMVIMNLKKIRNIGGSKKFLEETLSVASNSTDGFTVTEQDIFNKLFVDNITYLPLKYNFYINNSSNFENCRHYYPFCFSRETIEEAFSNPVIIHYTLPEKPWIYSNAEKVYGWPYKKYRKIWDTYYYESPLQTKKLLRRKISFIKTLWINFLKPILKQVRFLVKIKRNLYHTPINSPIHDFFD